MFKIKVVASLLGAVFLMINSAQAAPVKYQALTQEERTTLQQATHESPSLKFASAGGSDCRTTWHTDPNSGEQTQRTVCDDTSSSSGPTPKLGPGFLRGCIVGGLGGALIGSLGGAAGAGAGLAIGCIGGGFLNRE